MSAEVMAEHIRTPAICKHCGKPIESRSYKPGHVWWSHIETDEERCYTFGEPKE